MSKTGQLKATTSKTEKLLASILTIMKPIRIVKRSADRDANTTGTQKPDEPSTSKIVNTVKSWIAESQERKRSQRRSLTALGVVISQQRGQATLLTCSISST